MYQDEIADEIEQYEYLGSTIIIDVVYCPIFDIWMGKEWSYSYHSNPVWSKISSRRLSIYGHVQSTSVVEVAPRRVSFEFY